MQYNDSGMNSSKQCMGNTHLFRCSEKRDNENIQTREFLDTCFITCILNFDKNISAFVLIRFLAKTTLINFILSKLRSNH